mmetsp:Transcript_12765/g.45205  ORF Transcript_12765/g.45205 Transcript_12765/m.45205 type:complete len:246 (-) Transcript_12765:327-1064(-)
MRSAVSRYPSIRETDPHREDQESSEQEIAVLDEREHVEAICAEVQDRCPGRPEGGENVSQPQPRKALVTQPRQRLSALGGGPDLFQRPQHRDLVHLRRKRTHAVQQEVPARREEGRGAAPATGHREEHHRHNDPDGREHDHGRAKEMPHTPDQLWDRAIRLDARDGLHCCPMVKPVDDALREERPRRKQKQRQKHQQHPEHHDLVHRPGAAQVRVQPQQREVVDDEVQQRVPQRRPTRPRVHCGR